MSEALGIAQRLRVIAREYLSHGTMSGDHAAMQDVLAAADYILHVNSMPYPQFAAGLDTEKIRTRWCTACGAPVSWGRMGPREYHDCKQDAGWSDYPIAASRITHSTT